MTYKEYEVKAITTKCYADEVAIPYVVIGLNGEIGELCEKIEQEAKEDLVIKELGDIFWYMAGIRVELNLQIEEDWNWLLKPKSATNILQLLSESGKISEQIKKFLRDDYKTGEENIFPEKRRKVIEEAWKNIWLQLNTICDSMNTSIEEVARINNEKLASRKERNVIHGSGDER